MKLLIRGHTFRYEMENLTRMFFPDVNVSAPDEGDADAPDTVVTEMRHSADGTVEILVRLNGEKSMRRSVSLAAGASEQDAELAMGRALYGILSAVSGTRPPWGILTGVRPVRLCRSLCAADGEDKTRLDLERQYLVRQDKIDLALGVEARQRGLLKKADPNGFSLYVSIPFCPSRCLYCSFISHDLKGAAKLIPDYIRHLCSELRYIGEIARRLGLYPQTVYIGGGTPTVLESGQLELVMRTVKDSFDMSGVLEYTVEAGRPDTVTEDKLEALRRMGADRVSVNPQTMDDGVLREIGRGHTAAQTVNAFLAAREAGFDRINMDLIAGLPKDTQGGFERTLNRILKLRPENITVHTLTVKRSSRLKEQENEFDADAAEKMLEHAGKILAITGYAPYYLYRQKGTVGNLENTGYALSGREGLYNVLIMEEAQTILAVGAGAVSKLIRPDMPVRRVFNYKFPYEYIGGFDKILSRKSELEQILREHI